MAGWHNIIEEGIPEELHRLSNAALGAGRATSVLGITVLLEMDKDLLIDSLHEKQLESIFNSIPKVKTNLQLV